MPFMLNHKARLQCAPPARTGCPGALRKRRFRPCSRRTGGAGRAVEYSVINLGPDAWLAVFNQRGQAAFASWSPDEIVNGFFDGQRVHALPSLGGSFTYVRGLNNLGVVVGQSAGCFTQLPCVFLDRRARHARPARSDPGRCERHQ